MILLDTHIWLRWVNEDSASLSEAIDPARLCLKSVRIELVEM